MVASFEQGDIVYLDFDPQTGHEQRGHRPALVVSNNLFNKVSSLTMVCPITRTDRTNPLHVRLEGGEVDGFIMCDQARMLDLEGRKAHFVEKASPELVAEVVDIIIGCVEIL